MDNRGPSLDSVESDAISRESSTSSANNNNNNRPALLFNNNQLMEQPLQPVMGGGGGASTSATTTVRLQPVTSSQFRSTSKDYYYQQQPQQPQSVSSRSSATSYSNQQPQQPVQLMQPTSNNNNNNNIPYLAAQNQYYFNHHENPYQPDQATEQPPQPLVAGFALQPLRSTSASNHNHHPSQSQPQQQQLEQQPVGYIHQNQNQKNIHNSNNSSNLGDAFDTTKRKSASRSATPTDLVQPQQQQATSRFTPIMTKPSSTNKPRQNEEQQQRQLSPEPSKVPTVKDTHEDDALSPASPETDNNISPENEQVQKMKLVDGNDNDELQRNNLSTTSPLSDTRNSTSAFNGGDNGTRALSASSLTQKRRIRQLEQEKEDFVQKHQDEMHKMNLELRAAKVAVELSTKTNEAMEARLRAALEGEKESERKNEKMKEVLDNLTTRAKTKDGELASWDDAKNTLYVNHIKGRFEISVLYFESLLDLSLFDKKLCQEEMKCYQRTQEKMEQLLNESEQLREEMQTTAIQADETHIRNLDMAQRTIDELQREILFLKENNNNNNNNSMRTGSISNNNLNNNNKDNNTTVTIPSRGVTPSPTIPNSNVNNNNNNHHPAANNTQNQNHNNNNMITHQHNQSASVVPTRGASSTYLRSATAPIDPEATSRKLKEELEDALQSKESLTQANRQQRRRICELEDEMRNLYDESRRVHEMMRHELRTSKELAYKETNDEIARLKEQGLSINSGLISRVGSLETILEDRTHALLLAQQQVKHLTELLEDACRAGGVPLLRTSNPGSIYQKLTLGRNQNQNQNNNNNSSSFASPKGGCAPMWATTSPYNSTNIPTSNINSNNNNNNNNIALFTSPKSNSTPTNMNNNKSATRRAEQELLLQNNQNSIRNPSATTSSGWVAGSLASTSSINNNYKPGWNNSLKLTTAQQHSTPPPKPKRGFGLPSSHHQDPQHLMMVENSATKRGYTAGLVPQGNEYGNNNNYDYRQQDDDEEDDEDYDNNNNDDNNEYYENNDHHYYRSEEY